MQCQMNVSFGTKENKAILLPQTLNFTTDYTISLDSDWVEMFEMPQELIETLHSWIAEFVEKIQSAMPNWTSMFDWQASLIITP